MNYEYQIIYDGHSQGIELDVHQRILNAYGEKGWELLDVKYPVPTPRSDTSFVYFFKRPIST
jgi:hypothetical protein